MRSADRRLALGLGALLTAMVLAACKREPSDPKGSAPSAPASTTVAAPPPRERSPDRPATAGAGPLAGEPTHRIVREGDRDRDAMLRPFVSRVRAHFRESKVPLFVQRASLFGGGAATLVSEVIPSDTMPLLLVEDRERKLLWDRERPTQAMLPPVRDPIVLGRPKGGVALFAYDVPAQVVAGRLADADGTPFADLNVIRGGDCHRMTAAFWPRRGMLVVCSKPGGGLMQIVREDNTLALDAEGVAIGEPFRIPAPMSVAIEDSGTFLLAQYATSPKREVDRVTLMRFDDRGRPAWPKPKDVGEIPRVTAPVSRLVVTPDVSTVRVVVGPPALGADVGAPIELQVSM